MDIGIGTQAHQPQTQLMLPIQQQQQQLQQEPTFFTASECEQFSTIIPGRLYFVCCSAEVAAKLSARKDVHSFNIDKELVYENFYNDFGPLNLSMLYRYCVKVQRKLSSAKKFHKKIVHVCGTDGRHRVNSAYLMGSFQVLSLQRTAEEAIASLETKIDYIAFRDAALGPNTYPLTLRSCLCAVEKAFKLKWLDFATFSCDEYEFYERVENGDFNWILPKKILAFCGPHNVARIENSQTLHSPETYFSYFRKHCVTDVVRLNKKMYDASKFTDNGFRHHDLYFLDGSTPTDEIMLRFIEICEHADGAVAVHCKAGLGRTGTLIACYIMKHFLLAADEAIAWLRICRPGSVIGVQQHWLQDKQEFLWSLVPDRFVSDKLPALTTRSPKDESTSPTKTKENITVLRRVKRNNNPKVEQDIIRCVADITLDIQNNNINSNDNNEIRSTNNNNNSSTNINISSIYTNNNFESQGDRLNKIKAVRRQRGVEKI